MRFALRCLAMLAMLATLAITVTTAGAQGASAAKPIAAPAGAVIPKDMTPYFVAFVVKGEKFSAEQTPENAALTVQHLAFIKDMVEKKIFLVVGPFADGARADSRILGMAILTASSADEARRLLEQDPEFKAGHVGVEVHPAMFPSLAALKISY